MNASDYQKYKNKSISQLIVIATRHFNKFIRLRDARKGCISCGAQVTEAGHYLSAGNYSIYRFNEDNVNGQCNKCNRHLSGNLINYRIGLVQRIGKDRVEFLEGTRHNKYKWDRFTLVGIITKYKSINKTK